MDVEFSISLDDYLSCQWQHSTLEGQLTCYDSLVRSLQDAHNVATNQNQKTVLNLLIELASFVFNPAQGDIPFSPAFKNRRKNERAILPKDIGSNTLKALAEILPHIHDSLLKARVADTVWLGGKPKRDPVYAVTAIEEYCEVNDVANLDPFTLKNNLMRALVLGHQLKYSEKTKAITESAIALFKQHKHSSPEQMLSLAKMLHRGDFDRRNLSQQQLLGFQCEIDSMGQSLATKGNYMLAQEVFKLSSEKASQLENSEAYNSAKAMEGLCYYELAKECQSTRPYEAHFNATKALSTLRQVERAYQEKYSVDSLIEDVRRALPKYGRSTQETMIHEVSSGLHDLSEMASGSKTLVAKHNSPESAVSQLAHLAKLTMYSDAVKEEKMTTKTFLSDLIGSAVHFERDGRVVAKASSTDGMAMQLFKVTSTFYMKGGILPAMEQIKLEHSVDLDLFEGLCRESPIVPSEQQEVIARGLFLGWTLYLTPAVYILAPHLEQIIRVLLKDADAITTHDDNDGISRETGMGTLLQLPQCHKVLGEELTTELKAIFTNATGYNVRNDVAHGLLTDRDGQTVMGLHAWWIILRIIIEGLNGYIPKSSTAH